MLNLEELEKFVSFGELGTLTKVADRFSVSVPSVTRAMQNIEECYGVPLFVRSGNRIELNENGKEALLSARKLLSDAESSIRDVREYDRRRKTVVVKSCAPAPLWALIPALNDIRGEKVVSSEVMRSEDVLSAWKNGDADIVILPYPIEGSRPFLEENLFVAVPSGSELASRENVTFSDLDGMTFLLRYDLSFWGTLCRNRMKNSKFLVQSDTSVFVELVKASSIPCFTTDRAKLPEDFGRVSIPLSDSEAHVMFYKAERR